MQFVPQLVGDFRMRQTSQIPLIVENQVSGIRCLEGCIHKLTPQLGVLQDRGFRVALVTDGRMSGASGKVPAAIHVTPEAALGGPLARVRDGDQVTVDADTGVLEVELSDAELEHRESTGRAPHDIEWAGTGRELFSGFRAIVGTAETGASVIRPLPAPSEEAPLAQHV